MRLAQLLAVWVATAALVSATEKLSVVATIPDLADISREIGGDRVSVKAIAKARQNIHAVRVLPSHVVAMSRADVFVQMGLAMEHAWVPGLLLASRNQEIQPDQPGFVNVSADWSPIQVGLMSNRQQAADVHPFGNPHFNLHPEAGRHIATQIADAFCRIDPGSADGYRTRLNAYLVRIEEAEERWAELGAQLKGVQVVEYHREFDYLLQAHGIELLAVLEPKPGVPPSPRHLAQVIGEMRSASVKVILTAAWSNNSAVVEVARKTKSTILELPSMSGGSDGTGSWIQMMDQIHVELATAFGLEFEPGS